MSKNIIKYNEKKENWYKKRKYSFVANGRIAVFLPEHPKANGSGYVLRSRWIMEKKIGRYLGSNEVVHHLDGNKSNDKLDNLYLTTINEHIKLHISPRKLDYALIEKYMRIGFGYKRIAKILSYSKGSVKYATRCIKKELGVKGIYLDILSTKRISQTQVGCVKNLAQK